MGKPLTILFFGPPGAGKTTQFSLLASLLEEQGGPLLPFSWAEVRDRFMRSEGHVQQRLQELHASGKRLPLFFSTSLWGTALMKEFKGNEHLLVDGVPRHAVEAEMFDSLLDLYGRDEVQVLNFTISPEAATERLEAREREDDHDSGIRERLAWYQKETLPVLDFFKNASRYHVHEIDASSASEEVHASIKKELGL